MREPRGGEGEREVEDEEDEWADIPTTERLFDDERTIATAAYRHLADPAPNP
jgi:hypothetical protein